MSADLEALAARVEGATADEERTLLKSVADQLWGFAFAPEGVDPEAWMKRWNRFSQMLAVGGYMDAALLLVPEEWVWTVNTFAAPNKSASAYLINAANRQIRPARKYIATPALALCAAALRARAAEGRG